MASNAVSKVYLSSDHAGLELRQALAAHLQAAGLAVEISVRRPVSPWTTLITGRNSPRR